MKMKSNYCIGIAAILASLCVLRGQDLSLNGELVHGVATNDPSSGSGIVLASTLSADLLLGSGYVTVPLGASMGFGDGEFTQADRTSSRYLGGALNLEITDLFPKWGLFEVEVSRIQGRSVGVFRDLSALTQQESNNFTSDYRLDEEILQVSLRKEILYRNRNVLFLGIGYIQVGEDVYGAYETDLIRGKISQSTRDHLGSMGATYQRELLAINGFTLFARSELDLFAGARKTKFREQLSLYENEYSGEDRIHSLVYGGSGRLLLKAYWVPGTRGQLKLYAMAGIQARYLLNDWEKLPDNYSVEDERLNVRGSELLWGPYFQLGAKYEW